MSRDKVLITGGAGYIGSHVCLRLSEAGYQPITFDNLSNGHRWAVQWGPLAEGDLQVLSDLHQAFAIHRPIAVVHLAALSYVGDSVKNPDAYYRNNVTGTLNLLQIMKQFDVRKLVFSSTAATYGEPKETPIPETHSTNPLNPYGRSKLFIESILNDYQRQYGLDWTSLRYFNAAGADPKSRIGEVHDPETHLIPLCLKAANGEIPKVSVFGTDYETKDGTCIRDYIHVSDLADAHVLALQKDKRHRIFNLGTESGYSVMEIIESVKRVSGKSVPHERAGRRAGDPGTLIASSALAKSELGWSPNYTGLDQLIQTAWDWENKKSSPITQRAPEMTQ